MNAFFRFASRAALGTVVLTASWITVSLAQSYILRHPLSAGGGGSIPPSEAAGCTDGDVHFAGDPAALRVCEDGGLQALSLSVTAGFGTPTAVGGVRTVGSYREYGTTAAVSGIVSAFTDAVLAARCQIHGYVTPSGGSELTVIENGSSDGEGDRVGLTFAVPQGASWRVLFSNNPTGGPNADCINTYEYVYWTPMTTSVAIAAP